MHPGSHSPSAVRPSGGWPHLTGRETESQERPREAQGAQAVLR